MNEKAQPLQEVELFIFTGSVLSEYGRVLFRFLKFVLTGAAERAYPVGW
jgi:hypothetical protein